MSTRMRIAGCVAGLALVVGATAAIEAREQGPGGFGPGGGFGRRGPGGPGGLLPGLRGLDLTESQREQVKAIMESHKADFEAQAQKLGPARQALRDVIAAETLDETAIRQRAAELAAVEADGAVLQARVHAQVSALLTPEQQQKARDAKAQQAQRRSQMRQRMEQRRNQRQQQRG
jgi:periplasmic protein CpxP/Spy